jgi:Na+/alanine symporter
MKTISRIIVVLAVFIIAFSQVAYLWKFEDFFFDLGNFIDSVLALFHGVIIYLLTRKSKEEFKSESERKLAESKLRYSAVGLLIIDILWAISYYCILYGS